MTPNRPTPPWWFTALVCLLMMPLLLWPPAVAELPAGEAGGHIQGLVYGFPIYAVTSAYLAYRCHSERRELSRILLAVLVLSYGAVAILLIR